jgi:hypothetical protein
VKQVQITKKTPLLGPDGSVLVPGYCKTNLFEYDRAAIRANPTRIKEWDFYQISDSRYTLQMVFADISLGGMGNFTLFDRKTGERFEQLSVSPLTFGRLGLEPNTEEDHSLSKKGRGFSMGLVKRGRKRWLTYEGRIRGSAANAHIELIEAPGHESLVMAVPFDTPGYFYYNQKMNCLPAKGVVTIGGRHIVFSPDDAFCVLDWGRGVWPYRGSWYWGNGSTWFDGRLFGFEIGWGFGDMSAATENMLFYDGRAHKIGAVFLQKDADDWMKPWVFSSDDGRFSFTMTPAYDNFTSSRVGPVGNVCHQVFGDWCGAAVLDDGTVLRVEKMLAFCEFSDNRW